MSRMISKWARAEASAGVVAEAEAGARPVVHRLWLAFLKTVAWMHLLRAPLRRWLRLYQHRRCRCRTT